MKHNWLVFILMAMVAGLLTHIITGRSAYPPESCSYERLSETSFLIQKLDLSYEQAQKIKLIHTDLAVDLQDCQIRHCKSRSRLGQLLAVDGEKEEIEALVAEMCQIYQESEMATLRTIARVRELLDDKQREKFDRLVVECTGCRCGHNE